MIAVICLLGCATYPLRQRHEHARSSTVEEQALRDLPPSIHTTETCASGLEWQVVRPIKRCFLSVFRFKVNRLELCAVIDAIEHLLSRIVFECSGEIRCNFCNLTSFGSKAGSSKVADERSKSYPWSKDDDPTEARVEGSFSWRQKRPFGSCHLDKSKGKNARAKRSRSKTIFPASL